MSFSGPFNFTFLYRIDHLSQCHFQQITTWPSLNPSQCSIEMGKLLLTNFRSTSLAKKGNNWIKVYTIFSKLKGFTAELPLCFNTKLEWISGNIWIYRKKIEYVYQNSTFIENPLQRKKKSVLQVRTSEFHKISGKNLNDSDKIWMNGRSGLL